MLSKITKKDLAFDSKIRKLPPDWFDYNPLLILQSRHLGMAEQWKFIVQHGQRDAAKSLFYANSNQHSVGHKIIRRNNRIVLSLQVVEKAYYLRYSIVLLQACGDKLAQVIRCFLNIRTWKSMSRRGIKRIRAKESNTILRTLANHLRSNKKKGKALLLEIDSYLNDESVSRILQLANEIKHKWITSYQGEGLQPLRNPFKQGKDNKGSIVEVATVGMTSGTNIESHIADALITNNKFVELAIKIDKLIKEKARRLEGQNGGI